jgi:hypothetical protein
LPVLASNGSKEITLPIGWENMINITPKAQKAFKDLAAKEGSGARLFRIVTTGFG